MLQQTISAIRPQTWEAVNRAVLASAKQDKLESGATVRFQPAAWGPLAEAMRLLGVPDNFTREDIIAAFKREVKKAHPDVGGGFR